MATLTLTLETPCEKATTLLLGLPIDTPEQRFLGHVVEGVPFAIVTANNSGQRALRLECAAGARPVVRFDVAEAPGTFADWVFAPTGGRHEMPSPELATLMAEIAPASLSPAERVEAIVRHVEARFTYGVREIGLGDDTEAMPPLVCDTHLGTCVDTHSYAVAAMRAAGIPAAYISGLFVPEGETAARPGHCWFVVNAPGAPHHWDISHFLKYHLGRVEPVLNPKPGYRFAMSVGRDLEFDGPAGPARVPRLSGFVALSAPEEKLGTLAEVSGRALAAAAE